MAFDYFNLPKKRMASGALIRNNKGEILIVKPSYRDGWLIPGGIVEENESPHTTCVREIKEELDLEIDLSNLLVVDYCPSEENYSEGVEFIFDGGILEDIKIKSIKLQQEELLQYLFVSEETLKDKLVPKLYPRIIKALESLKNQGCYYTEQGDIV